MARRTGEDVRGRLAVVNLRGHLAAVLTALAMLAGLAGLAASPAQAAKYAAIVVDADSGTVLYANNADERKYPASLTKMMTLYMLFDALKSGRVRLDTPMKVSSHAAAQSPSKLGLRKGQTIRVEDAIKAVVTKSANDVAVVIAEHLNGSETAFAAAMTARAKAIGMSRTTYRNASGLPNPGQMSTARDQATLSLALRRDFPQYYPYFQTTSFRYGGQTYGTHNRVLLNYQGADGLKTGYIRASGFNLATSARRGSVSLVGVVFGGKTAAWRDQHMMSLLDTGFARAAMVAQGRTPRTAPPIILTKPAPPAAAPVPAMAAASPSPTAPSPQAGSGGAEQWGVQVGAFVSQNSARKQAEKAAAALRPLTGPATVSVTRYQSPAGPLYRARVIGLDGAREARAACQHLEHKRKMRCAVVTPRGVDVAQTPAAR